MHGFEHIVLIGDSGGNQAGMKAVAEELSAKWAAKRAGAAQDALIHFIPEYYDLQGVTDWLEARASRRRKRPCTTRSRSKR